MDSMQGNGYILWLGQAVQRHGRPLAWGMAALQLVLLASVVYLWATGAEPPHQPPETAMRSNAPQRQTFAWPTIEPKQTPLAQPQDDAGRLLFALSQSAATVGVAVGRVKMLPAINNQHPAVVLNMVATYAQHKQFLHHALQAEPRLALQKLTAQRLPMPATAVSFEATFAVLPAHAPLNVPAMALPADWVLLDAASEPARPFAAEQIAASRPTWAMQRPLFAPALRDIFALPQPARAATPPPALPPMAPPPDLAPAPNVRFLGRFVSPNGTATVYLVQAGEEMEAKLGETLPNGYVVASFSEVELRLVYPRLGTRVVVPLGAEP